jgi:SHS2 domain-containing protein
MTYRQIEHTADLALEIEAPTQADLLAEGARAIVAILTEDAEVRPRDPRTVEIDALDDEDRLVQFLNEVLVLAIVEGYLTAEADIELSAHHLVAHLRGEAGAQDRVRTELKAVTYHDLHLAPNPDGTGWQARIVIDV